MPLNKYQKLCYRWFGRVAEKKVSDKLNRDLEAAHITIRGGAYLSCAWFNSIMSYVISLCISVFFLIILFPMLGITVEIWMLILFLIFPAIIGAITYFVYLQLPSSRAKMRAKKIEVNLPYALNFISAMSSAGVTPTEIFKSLSKQDIYGEIKEEASWIYRDVVLLGTDILTAIKNNIERTPSQKFKEFLQGTVVTVTSGGSLKSYFMTKAEQYMQENRQAQKQLLESLGIMAESYVTAAVAGILLIMIVIPLMMIINGDISQLNFMYVFIFLIVPLIHSGFAFVIKSMSQGV